LSLKHIKNESKTIKKGKSTLSKRRSGGRLDEGTKEKIVSGVRSGLLSKRAAGRK